MQDARSAEHNVASWISQWANDDGARDAVADDHRRLDYAAFEQRVARLAGWLEEHGVGFGDRVAILLGNCTPYLEALFAAARLGAITLPINTRLSPREVTFLFDDCTPRVLIHGEPLRELADRACNGAGLAPRVRLEVASAKEGAVTEPALGACADYEAALAEASPSERVAPVSPEDPVILMYTSGTTGAPKGALLPHRKALYNAKNAERYFNIVRDDRVLVVAPLFHSLGLQILSLPVAHAGGALILQSHFEPEAVWRAVDEERITYFGGVPTMYRRLLEQLQQEPGRFDLTGLRFLFTAGAAAPAEMVRAFTQRGLLLVQGYGQTETSTLTCLAGEDAERKAGTVGLPVHHGELRIIASDSLAGAAAQWRDVDVDEPGEIVVRGPILMLGYWQRPEANAETLREGWLLTGDLATRDSEGFITLVGRSREMFISGGENVYPAEVEACYAEHPSVLEIAVVAEPDARWGEVGCAYIVLRRDADTAPEELTAWGRERLARFKLPARFVFARELPKTASGKVQKHRLAGDAAKGPSTPA
jgi:fatty-acyl-CoA synthase